MCIIRGSLLYYGHNRFLPAINRTSPYLTFPKCLNSLPEQSSSVPRPKNLSKNFSRKFLKIFVCMCVHCLVLSTELYIYRANIKYCQSCLDNYCFQQDRFTNHHEPARHRRLHCPADPRSLH